MFEFNKMCDEYQRLTNTEKRIIIAEKTIKIFAELSALNVCGIDPFETLAGFIVGSVVADGKINEQEYLLMYPTLVQIFGKDFDYNSVKKTFATDAECKNSVCKYTENMLKILTMLNENIKTDVIILCLCVVSMDGKINFKERKYIKRLCKA